MQVLVITQLDPYSGYGQDGIGLVDALARHGFDVHLSPTLVCPPLPTQVANLLTKQPSRTVDVMIVLGDPGELPPDVPAATIAWTSWPWPWQPDEATALQLSGYSLVLGYDTAILDVGRSSPTAALHPGFQPRDWPVMPRDWHTPKLSFCTVGPQSPGVVRAFAELTDEHPTMFADAELHMGVRGDTEDAFVDWAPRTYVHPGIHRPAVRRDFYRNSHVLIAPVGGRNQPALEFMATGGLVVAPAAGTTQWLSASYGYPLPAAAQQDLKDVMLHIAVNRGEAKNKAATAVQLIPAMCGWDAVIDRLGNIAAEHLGDVGQLLRRRIHAAQANKVTGTASHA